MNNTVNTPPATDPTNAAATSKQPRWQWRYELWWSAGGLLVGLTVLPLLIYLVGTKLLGGYSINSNLNGTLSLFYQRFYGTLMSGSLAAWSIVLVPALMVTALRFSLTGWHPSTTDSGANPSTDADVRTNGNSAPSAQTSSRDARREPFIGS